MKRSASAFLVVLAWAAGLAALGLLVERRLNVGSDLRLFLPAPATPEQRLLLDAIGEGPASRLLVVTIEGAPAEALGAASSALVATLRGDERFRFVANGDVGLDLLPEDLLPYRYLLSRRRRDSCVRSREPPRRAPSSRTRLALAGRLRRRAVDRARSDFAHVDTGGTLAAGERAAPRVRRLVRRGRRARAAGRRDARAGVRSGRPTSARSPRSTQPSRPRTPRPARH